MRLGALLALLSSVAWGTADFGGGIISKRVSPLASVLLSQGAAMLVMVVIVVVTGDFHLNIHLLWAVFSGIIGPLALAAYYRALAVGPMGVIGPISATAGLVPLVVGLSLGDTISPVTLVALLGCIVGVGVVSGQHLSGFQRTNLVGVGLALISALGFGLVFVALAQAAPYGIVATLFVQRITNTLLIGVIVLFRRDSIRNVDRRTGLSLAGVGILDVAANGIFSLSNHFGQLALVGALGSIYPLATVILAAVFLHERLQRWQLVGAVLTLACVGLASAG